MYPGKGGCKTRFLRCLPEQKYIKVCNQEFLKRRPCAIPLLRGVEGWVTGISANTPPPQHIQPHPSQEGHTATTLFSNHYYNLATKLNG